MGLLGLKLAKVFCFFFSKKKSSFFGKKISKKTCTLHWAYGAVSSHKSFGDFHVARG